jgi:hypothetical protein
VPDIAEKQFATVTIRHTMAGLNWAFHGENNNQSTRLYLINTGYQLACYLAMGAILAVWPR